MNRVQDIRHKFIDYFVKNDHEKVNSSSLIPHNDPSLMFVNSGMVQFKDTFTGNEIRSYTKAVSAQKCVRAGGKHNDLDNVGYTARHHTFFEMLGNFSFGDYFKEKAIYHAWNLITKDFGLDKSRLYATVYHTDTEAFELWRKIAGLDDSRIIKISTNDNFWSMGDFGPCGPCSEIFYDHGPHIEGGLPGTETQDGDRFIEIWNMVFMQFEQVDKETRIELPKKSIDTGMGLERMSAVMQGKHNNYDIDLFAELIDYTADLLKKSPTAETLSSYRVITDHLRASAFLIADGIIPANEGRGYVLRRIMRRAMRHIHILGAKEPLMYKLLPRLADLMGEAYPELRRAGAFISDILEQEETRFKTTLERGLKLLNEEVALVDDHILPGKVAFKLYDTYGFPLDLTQDILKSQNINVDITEFDEAMLNQKQLARSSWLGSGENKTSSLWFDLKNEFGNTEFLGYSETALEAEIIAIIKDNEQQNSFDIIDEEFLLVVNQTPFYGESGGQLGDIGIIEGKNFRIKVVNTHKYLGAIIAHLCILEQGSITIGDVAKLTIDHNYRQHLRANHTATHILHSVLRKILGDHIAQKGSLVAHDRFRFDFSHNKALTKTEIKTIEDVVNKIILSNMRVDTKLMSADEAIASGAMALFGEKYDSEVRVVSIGTEIIDDSPYSLELCGGTHAQRTGDIGYFKIISESAIANGVRRIEAASGEFAIGLARHNENLISEISALLKATPIEITDKISSLITHNKKLQADIFNNQLKGLDLNAEYVKSQMQDCGQVNLLYREVDNLDAKLLRTSIEQISNKLPNLIVIYSIRSGSKINLLIAVEKNISNRFKANIIAKDISTVLGGGGGGNVSLAQLGGIDEDKLTQINKIVQDVIKATCK